MEAPNAHSGAPFPYVGAGRRVRRGALRIAGTYAVVAAAWILLSDRLLPLFGNDALLLVSSAKGVFFVAATAWMLYVLVRRQSGSLERSLAELQREVAERHRVEVELRENIAERRAAEEELRLLSAALAGAPTAISLSKTDRNGTIVWVNRAFTELTGYSEKEAVGRSYHMLSSGFQDEAFYSGLWETISRGDVWRGELVNRRKDGVLYREEMGVTPLRDEAGRITHYLAIKQDITQRKRVEKELRRSREGLRQLANASLQVLRQTDVDALFQAVSAAALELTGARIAVTGHGYVSGRFVIGGATRAPGMPDCPPGKEFLIEKGGVYMDLMEGAADSLRLTDEEMRAHPLWWGLPEGHVPMRGLLGVRLRDRQGRTRGMILVTDKEQDDFTAEDESRLQQLATLASLAAQHVEARISLEEADRRKDEFLAMLSHELRNPLAPIRNSIHILDLAAPGSEQARRAHAVIDRQVGHLTRLVDDLLDVTRIVRGKVQLHSEPLDFAELVRRAVDDHRSSIVHSGLELEVQIPEGPIWMSADRTRIAQVIGNLLNNAAKFTPPPGKVTVSVEVNHALHQGIASVRDTGAGISPDLLPRVFEPFTQAEMAADRRLGGLGLGLALVKGLVEMHGGTVDVVSEGPGHGTKFTLRLPLATGAAESAGAQPSSRRTGPSRRVLVVEDGRDAAESLREVLELEGHTVGVAHSGTEGIEKARSFRPDMVLCDIGLPGVDGYAVARALRADPLLAGTRLVALSGYAAPEDVARASEAGFDDHLAKPPDIDQLRRLLAGRPAPGTTP